MVLSGTAAIPLQSSSGETALFAIFLVPVLLQIAGMWKVFTKAGKPGWAAIIPIYNLYVMLDIGDNDWWWLLVLLVPVVQLYASYKIVAGVARSFDRGIGFALGLLFLGFVFFPLLGFGDYRYSPPNRGQGAVA
jgi:hypothetical protein